MKLCPACSREYGDETGVCADDGVTLVHLDTSQAQGAQDLIGQVVDGRYRVERVVGRGGMGTVYACRHVVVGKAFAMKVLKTGIERNEEILQRFIREAQAANAVKSRHICEMTDFGQLPSGAFYVVMELLDGVSLTRALREQKLTTSIVRRVFIQIAETLQRAHDQHIIHRDLKPDNVVLVHDEGDPFFVKLVDFGIAKMLQGKASNLTETGVILGTPYYMSPEQARGDPIDHRSDIYALGVMMFRAFTGKLPFVADTAMGVLTRHLIEKPPLPSTIAEIDGATERLILRCLEKLPIDRFQSMADVAEALRALPDKDARPRRDSLADRTTAPRSLTPARSEQRASAPRSLTPARSEQRASAPRSLTPARSEQRASAPRSQEVTPTRVATPAARDQNLGSAPISHAPISQGPSPMIPPPMPAPVIAPPAMREAFPSYPVSPAPAGSFGPPSLGLQPPLGAAQQPSPNQPWPMGSAAADGSAQTAPRYEGLHGEGLHGEAHTNRGVVSSRMSAHPPAGRWRTWIAVTLAFGCGGAVIALVLRARPSADVAHASSQPQAAPTATSTQEKPSAASRQPSASESDSESDAAIQPSASTAIATSTAPPAASANATATARSAAPVRAPAASAAPRERPWGPPPTKPGGRPVSGDDIRSPFD